MIHAGTIVLIALSCGRQPEIVALSTDSPAYVLGKDLTPLFSALDPDSNRVFVKADAFAVSAGEMLEFIHASYGKQSERLKTFEAQQLMEFINRTSRQIVEKRLLLNSARKAKVKVTSVEVDSALRLQYARMGGEEAFQQYISENQIDFDRVHSDMEENLIISQHLQDVIDERSKVTEEEIQEAYQAFRKDTTATVRHILLLTQDKSESEKREIRSRMEEILTQAKSGADFAELARMHTEDPGSKENGGLYENFSRGTMVKPFEDAAFTIPIGEISDIVETRYGYHILKIVSRGPGSKSLEEMRPELEEQLRGTGRNDIVPDYIEELKEKAHVEFVTF